MKQKQEKIYSRTSAAKVHPPRKGNTGFTIVELLVTIAISMTIAAVVIASYPSLSSKTEFENLALDIALTIREAQVYGIGTLEAGAIFDVGYGVYFDSDDSQSFILFSDNNENNKYDAGEEVNTFSIKSTFTIADMCVNPGSKCKSNNGAGANVRGVAFIFKRPNPDAFIYRIKNNGDVANNTYDNGSVVIENTKDGSTKRITITNTGQISVN